MRQSSKQQLNYFPSKKMSINITDDLESYDDVDSG